MEELKRLKEVRDNLTLYRDCNSLNFDIVLKLSREAVSISESQNHILHGLKIDKEIGILKRSVSELENYTDKSMAMNEAFSYLISDINTIIDIINQFVRQ